MNNDTEWVRRSGKYIADTYGDGAMSSHTHTQADTDDGASWPDVACLAVVLAFVAYLVTVFA